MDEEKETEAFSFNGAFVKNADLITTKKSIVICGITRGGTSFAASVFGRLGIPFSRKSERPIGRRYEHRKLRMAFLNKDADMVKEIAAGFAEDYPVWAWKLPAIQRRLEIAAENVPNPHFVIIFKEPLSVATRKNDIKGKETLKSLQQVMMVYKRLAEIALTIEYPLLLISYDRAMRKLPVFLPEVAKFAGVESFDLDAAIAGIAADGQRYLRDPNKTGNSGKEAAARAEVPVRAEAPSRAKAPRKNQANMKTSRPSQSVKTNDETSEQPARSPSKSKGLAFL